MGGGSLLTSIVPRATSTDQQGRLVFQVRTLLPLTTSWTAQAGGVQLNPVRVVWLR
ncbi:MAG: hypothetical protein WEB52_09950 [Dehalococcoidia bacterium]